MFKRIGLIGLMLCAAGPALLPTPAFAQDRYEAQRVATYRPDREDNRPDVWEVRDDRSYAWRDNRDQDRREDCRRDFDSRRERDNP